MTVSTPYGSVTYSREILCGMREAARSQLLALETPPLRPFGVIDLAKERKIRDLRKEIVYWSGVIELYDSPLDIALGGLALVVSTVFAIYVACAIGVF